MNVVFNANIVNEEELVLRQLSRVLKDPIKYGGECAGLFVEHGEMLKQIQVVQDIADISPMVCEFLIAKVEEAHIRKVEEKKKKFEAKAHNRTEYLPSGVLEHLETTNKGGEPIRRWKGAIKLECAGLLPRIIEYYYGRQSEPVAISLLNSLPPSDELALPHDKIAPLHWDNLLAMGVAVSGERVGWQMNSPGWTALNLCFPSAIDARAYNHSLKAPLIQGGYLPEVQVRFANLWAQKPRAAQSLEEMMEEVRAEAEGNKVIFYESVPMGDDGSGRYHPDAPEMQDLISRYGLVPMQIRAMDTKRGIFAKGIIIPDTQALSEQGEPCIMLSWKQVKGRHKKTASDRAKENATITRSMHIGILRAWDRKRFMTGCFELLENISAVRREGESEGALAVRRDRIKEDLHSLVDETMEDLGKDGLEGLLASIAKDDKMMSLVVKLLAKAKSKGINIDPMSIDRVKNAISTKLRNRLWGIAQGAGIDGRQLVIVNDGSLEQGEVVTAHHKVGQKLACWRFPIVASQGLQVHTVVEARPHQLIGDKIPEQLVYMNPIDVLMMQGDDDGDIIACSTDKRVIRLFDNLIDDEKYQFEPKGEKLDWGTDSMEGLKYLRDTPMGPVGLMTINRAKLLAVGDKYGALAMSVLVQESIDKAKRKVRWTDWEKACDITNWKKIDGVWHVHYDGDTNYLDLREEEGRNVYAGIDDLPVKVIQKWVKSRLKMFGCDWDQSPIGWRKNFGEVESWDGTVDVKAINKQVDPNQWALSREHQNGYEGGNLVHAAWDRSWYKWQEIAGEFEQAEEKGDIGELLLRLLKEVAPNVQRPEYTWTEYMKVRELAGIDEFAENMKQAMSFDTSTEDGSDNKDRYTAIDGAYTLLHQRLLQYVQGGDGVPARGIQGLVDIWCMETTMWFRVRDENATWYTQYRDEVPEGAKFTRVSNPNHAINAVCWPKSPVMTLLGINGQDTCGFLNPERMKFILDKAKENPDAFAGLSEILWRQGDKPGPHEIITGIPAHACADCRDTLQTQLVRQFRSIKGRTEKQFLGRMCTSLNLGDNTQKRPGTYAHMGINVAELLALSNQDLAHLKEDLLDAGDRKSQATVRAITRILSGEGI